MNTPLAKSVQLACGFTLLFVLSLAIYEVQFVGKFNEQHLLGLRLLIGSTCSPLPPPLPSPRPPRPGSLKDPAGPYLDAARQRRKAQKVPPGWLVLQGGDTETPPKFRDGLPVPYISLWWFSTSAFWPFSLKGSDF